MTDLHEVALLRLVAQRLVGPAAATATDAVRWMTAVQGQDLAGATTSIALRTTSRSRPEVDAAMDAGEVVRSWPMRGTLHVVAAEDLRWMLQLMTPRVLTGASSRRAQLDLDEAALEWARDLAVSALSGGRSLGRAEVLSEWDDAGLRTVGQRGYHLIWYLAQTGTLCFGPLRDGAQQLVLLDEWVARPPALTRDDALSQLAERYFCSHGPATIKDFMRWGHLFAADARRGLASVRDRLTSIEVDGVEHVMDSKTPGLLDSCREKARGVFLLPGFDELILGYQDRTCLLAPDFASRIVPGGNGVFRSTVVSDGEVVGTWRHTGSGSRRRLEATPLRSFSAAVTDAMSEAYTELP